MDKENCNCIICAEEFDPTLVENKSLIKINSTNFKICINCLDKCDPSNDYEVAKSIVNSYLHLSDIRKKYAEVDYLLNIVNSKIEK